MTLRGILAAQLALQALGTYEVRAVGLSCHLCSPESRSLIYWRMPRVLVDALWAYAQIRFALRVAGALLGRGSNSIRSLNEAVDVLFESFCRGAQMCLLQNSRSVRTLFW